MLHELVPIMSINIQSHVKKSMIITEYLFKWQITNKKTYPDTINLNYNIYSTVCDITSLKGMQLIKVEFENCPQLVDFSDEIAIYSSHHSVKFSSQKG